MIIFIIGLKSTLELGHIIFSLGVPPSHKRLVEVTQENNGEKSQKRYHQKQFDQCESLSILLHTISIVYLFE